MATVPTDPSASAALVGKTALYETLR